MDSLTDLQTMIATDVQAGYDTRIQMIARAMAHMPADYAPQWTEEKAAALVDLALQVHYEDQRTWQGITDCDRIDEAFATLDRHGIIARQHFSCCQSCGHTEINTVIEQVQQIREVRGYVFFHRLDTESAMENGYFYLAYGSLSGKERESMQIADTVLTVLQNAGLNATWNGWVRSRVCINDVVWQRRRVPDIFASAFD